MLDQSAGKAIAVITKTKAVFCQLFRKSASKMQSRTIPHASAQITLVWLKTVVLNGTKGIPNAKLYAKCEIKANRKSRAIYFFTLRVWA